MRKYRLFIALVLVCAFFVAGCSDMGASDKRRPVNSVSEMPEEPETEPEIDYTVTLTFLSAEGDEEFINIIDEYNRTHPDQAVEIVGSEPESWEAYLARIASVKEELSSGGGADIIVLHREYMRSYYEDGLLIPIEEILSSNIKSELIPAILAQCSVNDTMVGFTPFVSSVTGCVVSSDLYSEGTWTVDDILKMMADHPELERTFVCDDRGLMGVRDEYGKLITAAEYLNFDTCFQVLRKDLTKKPFLDIDEKTADYTGELFMTLLGNMRRDRDSAVKSTDLSAMGRYLSEYFVINDIPSLIGLLGRSGDNCNLVALPGESRRGNGIKAGKMMVVNKNAKNPEGVREFLNFAISPEGQIAMGTRPIPVLADAAEYFVTYKEGEGNVWGIPASSVQNGIRVSRDFVIRLRGYDDAEKFKSDYNKLLNAPYSDDPGVSEVQEILYNEITEYLDDKENLIDALTVAENIQEQVQKYLDGLE